jgi:putative adenylate-forming enzyme
MRVPLLLGVVRRRGQLGRREAWTHEHVMAYQARSVTALREQSSAASPFYRRLHKGLASAPLDELPVLTKAVLMEHFDEVVTDRDVRLADVQSFLAHMRGAERFRGRYYVAATSGTTGQPGVFLWNAQEWATILASYNRPYAWVGAAFQLTKRTKMAVVSSTTPWHQSALVGATVDSPFIPTLRIDSSDPLDLIIQRLESFAPDVLVGYASMLRLLATEQIGQRLHIAPRATFSASEVLTDETRRRVEVAWGHQPVDVYAATETAGIAAECRQHAGLHLFEDLVVTEVVDEDYRPVPAGVYGTKVLVTVLGSSTLPLIRYEMSDSVRLSSGPACPCGRPFARIDGIQGREQESLTLPGLDGGHVVVQPVLFHRVMDRVPAAAWQIVRHPDGITVLVAGLPPEQGLETVVSRLNQELATIGVACPPIRVQRVDAMPRTALGKAPLIRSVPDASRS